MTASSRRQNDESILQSDAVHDLIARVRAQDDEAVRELVAEAMRFVQPVVISLLQQYEAKNTYISATMLHDQKAERNVLQDDAWELTHTICVTMLRKLDTFRGRNAFGRRARFTTWLYAIAQNEVRSTLRRRWREYKRRSTTSLDTQHKVEPHVDVSVAPPRYEPETEAIKQAEHALVREAIREAPLTKHQREAVIMYVVMGYRQKHIAERTGVQVGTVKKRIFDGLNKLRQYIEQSEQQSDAGGKTS